MRGLAPRRRLVLVPRLRGVSEPSRPGRSWAGADPAGPEPARPVWKWIRLDRTDRPRPGPAATSDNQCIDCAAGTYQEEVEKTPWEETVKSIEEKFWEAIGGKESADGEPNDGDFPTNLTDLTLVVSELHERGFYSGLWTSTGMPNIEDEVGVAGTRICKTDVGWIGDGYEYAFDGVELHRLTALRLTASLHRLPRARSRWRRRSPHCLRRLSV